MITRASGPILIVEDNPMDLDLTLQAFEENGVANRVQVCRDGEEAIAYVDAHADPSDPGIPVLVLLDLRLPRVDGIEVLAHLRSRPAWNRIPVVVLTTSRENADVARAYDLGANSYVVKPVDFASFAEVVRQVHVYWLLTNEPPGPDERGGPG